MKSKVSRLIIQCIFIGLSLFSCMREKDIVMPKSDYSNAFPLKVGNYWIYRTTITYPNDTKQDLNHLDSIWIEKDTVFNEKLYFIQMSTSTYPVKTFLRDSSDCIIANFLNYDDIIFSTNFKDTLYKNPPVYRMMLDIDQEVTVPAGTYKTANCKLLIRMDTKNHASHDLPLHDKDFMIHEQLLYANNVGLVKKESYYLGNVIEDKLIRYKVH